MIIQKKPKITVIMYDNKNIYTPTINIYTKSAEGYFMRRMLSFKLSMYCQSWMCPSLCAFPAGRCEFKFVTYVIAPHLEHCQVPMGIVVRQWEHTTAIRSKSKPAKSKQISFMIKISFLIFCSILSLKRKRSPAKRPNSQFGIREKIFPQSKCGNHKGRLAYRQ